MITQFRDCPRALVTDRVFHFKLTGVQNDHTNHVYDKGVQLFLKFRTNILVLTKYPFLNTFCQTLPIAALQRKAAGGKRN